MSRSTFRYYLRPDNISYYRVIGGSVSTTTVETPLSTAPMSWKDTDLGWIRKPEYAGIFRTFVVPVSFVRDGATILRYVRYTQGTEGRCILEIHRHGKKDSSGIPTDEYELFYSGDVDFSQATDSDFFFQAAILDGGLSALIKAYSAKPCLIPIQSSDAKTLYMDGRVLESVFPFGTLTDGSFSSAPTTPNNNHYNPTSGHGGDYNLSWDMYHLPMQGDIATGVTQNIFELDMDSAGGYPTTGSATNNNYAYRATRATDITVKINQPFEYKASLGANRDIIARFVAVHWSAATGAVVNSAILWTDPLGPVIGTSGTAGMHSFVSNPVTGSATFTGVAIDDRIFVFCRITGIFTSPATGWTTGGSFDLYFYDPEIAANAIEIKTAARLAASNIRSYTLAQAWDKIIADITGGAPYSAVSDFLNNPMLRVIDNSPYNTCISSGDAVRGLNTDTSGNPADPAIKTTLDDFYRSMSAIYMVGIGVEGTVARLEPLSYFFDNTKVIADLGLISGLKIGVAKEYLYNQIKIGYEKQSYDAVNGKDEFNTVQVYSTPAIRIKAEENKLSTYRADSYGIEFTRYNLTNKKNTDSESDNDVFLIESRQTINVGGGYELARLQNLPGNSATGILQPATAYNLSLSPKRNLFRNAPMISTAMHLVSGSLTFQTADKNQNLISQLGSGIVIESSDVFIGALDAPLFLPIYFTFETQVPINMPELIAATPYGRINLKWRNRKQELISLGGFITEVGIKPADNSIYTYKLLAAPDTDLSKLIN